MLLKLWFTAIGFSKSGHMVSNTAKSNSTTLVKNIRRHSVASHPFSSCNNNFSPLIHIKNLSTPLTVINSSTKMTISKINVTSTTNTSSSSISHQRTLSLPITAVAINNGQTSKKCVFHCMYFFFFSLTVFKSLCCLLLKIKLSKFIRCTNCLSFVITKFY